MVRILPGIPFVKNGQTVESWNSDGGTCSDQSYKCIPFYITSNQYGVLVNTADKVSFEVASDTINKVSFTVPGEELDYFFIGGADLKEVLKKLDIIIVGTGLGGASAAASLGELGYNVKVFCIQDSPRRAHSIAAQGGINAAKNYQNDNDSVYRLFYDTIKGGDYRAREANVYRMAEVANLIIDHTNSTSVSI